MKVAISRENSIKKQVDVVLGGKQLFSRDIVHFTKTLYGQFCSAQKFTSTGVYIETYRATYSEVRLKVGFTVQIEFIKYSCFREIYVTYQCEILCRLRFCACLSLKSCIRRAIVKKLDLPFQRIVAGWMSMFYG